MELPLSAAVTPSFSGRLARRAALACFGTAIVLGATLVFLVQPMVARLILPLFGGSQAVWTTSMLFFQAVLLAGYAYAHASTRLLGPLRQPLVHAVVLLLPLAALPIGQHLADPPADASPSFWLLGVLALSIGAPFFVITTASPLLQRWLSVSGHTAGRDPYFLYAAGNAGSLLALLAYPFVVEPYLTLGQQTRLWSAGYILFAALVLVCIVPARRGAAVAAATRVMSAVAPIAWSTRVRWVFMALVPSSLMLGATTYISTDIASAPLLWILPLATYLLTFVVAFARRPPVSVALAGRALAILAVPVLLGLLGIVRLPIPLTLLVHLLALFAAGVVAHGRLAQERPAPERLTEFYLLLSVGGVLGGVLNAVVAPLVFDSVLEYPLVLVLALLLRPRNGPRRMLDLVLGPLPLFAGLAGLVALGSRGDWGTRLAIAGGVAVLLLSIRRPVRFALGFASLAALMVLAASSLHAERTFFGVLRVTEGERGEHLLYHGTTLHGVERRVTGRRSEPLSYYSRGGPIGDVFAVYGHRLERVEVIGLGVGTLAAYGQPGRRMTFYELDPAVVEIASDPRLFTFLRDSRAQVEIVVGDGRRTLASAPDGAADLVVLDAFSSDAIPVHLLTREAVQLFAAKVRPDGVLAFHVTNRHLELAGVVAGIAESLGVTAVERSDDRPGLDGSSAPSHWIALARDGDQLDPLRARGWRSVEASGDRVWTDDYSNILSVVDWSS